MAHPVGDRERQRHTDHEGEGRLNQIMQRAPDPFDMRLMVAEELPETAFWQRRGHAAKAQCLRHHEEHDKATIGVERGQSLRLGLRYAGCHREWPNEYLG